MGKKSVLLSSMKTAIIVLALTNLISGATYKETRKVTDSTGKKFTCEYNIFYNSKTVIKGKSSVTCTPNTKGKPISEEFVIESLGKTVTVKHTIKKGKDTISSVSLKDYVAPTTSAPSPPSSSGESLDCSCRLPGMDDTVMGRSGLAFQLQREEDSERKILKPAAALTRGKGGGYHSGYHGHHGGYGSVSKPSLSDKLASLIPLAITAILAGLLALGGTTLLNLLLQTTVNIIAGRLGGSIPLDDLAQSDVSQARLLAKLNDRQLLGNLQPQPLPLPAPAPANPLLGLLGGNSGGGVDLGTLLGAASGSSDPSDLVNQIAIQVVQQQVEEFINSGGAEAALTDFIESGKMEEMVNNMIESAMENFDSEEFMQNIQSNLEENIGEVNGGLEELFSEVNLEEMMSGFKLEEMMGGMNMTEMMQGMDFSTMEMQMQCSCTPSKTT